MNRILIVEDEVPIAQLIEMSLARAGYQCEAVNDGCAAADKIANNLRQSPIVLLSGPSGSGKLHQP